MNDSGVFVILLGICVQVILVWRLFSLMFHCANCYLSTFTDQAWMVGKHFLSFPKKQFLGGEDHKKRIVLQKFKQ